MRCKPGDLALVVKSLWLQHVGERHDILRAGAIVRVTRLVPPEIPPGYRLLGPRPEQVWEIADPVGFCIYFKDGSCISGELAGVDDEYLRPIRDPGDDAVDEMVQRLGKPEGVRT